ncbi:MAG: (d)CMP kinase [Sphaerochaeta sp.]|uniref:(d)CMP kinase n=1 Tax=unclassified Sphaerochaeta TaxID=2637943 RepID=UPI000E9F4754|nr:MULTISPECIES: AAA family ATPase [unclassified Sphaerochaeta]MCK9599682.1 AAA family ATPase [Sphaerochaeta sp.]MDX9823695.1 AAA family ATPase [Sphaerochaeta sp.]HAP57195.1 cytidylate kinase [Sphaerochaeta sp.]HBO36782.1 cytidylate kinase [Sphaerochaeta sp.]HPE92246.1 AAA family ATPase [Sphaerochaeta sp.]
MRIAISGKSGCGNTTVSQLVADELGYPMINFTFRTLSEEKGIEFWTFCKMAEESDEFDLEVDRRQVEMALSQPDCVLGSRLAIWMLKQADLKVYLSASSLERARRIMQREGGTLEERLEQTRRRDANDSARYKRLYNIDNSDTSVADLVIDTSELGPEDVARIIIKEAKAREIR